MMGEDATMLPDAIASAEAAGVDEVLIAAGRAVWNRREREAEARRAAESALCASLHEFALRPSAATVEAVEADVRVATALHLTSAVVDAAVAEAERYRVAEAERAEAEDALRAALHAALHAALGTATDEAAGEGTTGEGAEPPGTVAAREASPADALEGLTRCLQPRRLVPTRRWRRDGAADRLRARIAAEERCSRRSPRRRHHPCRARVGSRGRRRIARVDRRPGAAAAGGGGGAPGRGGGEAARCHDG